ncbi:MAG: hypothetical protein ACREDR_17915, partial [Blastocatellia bacterium]
HAVSMRSQANDAGSVRSKPTDGAEHPNLFGAGMLCRRSSVRIQKTAIIGNTIDADQMGNRAAKLEDGVDTPGDRTTNGVGSADMAPDEARGGGLYFADCTVEIAGSTIQANEGYCAGLARGGGIYCERSRMRMWRSRVTDNALRASVSKGAGIYFKDPLGCELGGSVITGNGACAGLEAYASGMPPASAVWRNGTGGGIYIEGDSARVAIHRNTAVRQNHPDDVYPVKGSQVPFGKER